MKSNILPVRKEDVKDFIVLFQKNEDLELNYYDSEVDRSTSTTSGIFSFTLGSDKTKASTFSNVSILGVYTEGDGGWSSSGCSKSFC